MRYVSASNLKPGMILGRTLYGNKYEVLMSDGAALGASAIRRIDEMSYPGIYIDDELSKDIEVGDIISATMRLSTIKAARELHMMAENESDKRIVRKMSVASQQKIIVPIIESLLASERRVLDIVDIKPLDSYTYYHAANVVVISLLLGLRIGLSGTQLHELGMASFLHDVGNIFIPKYILQKPTKLTEREYDAVKLHTEKGFEYLRDNFEISIDACIGALHHHENYDGTGYPNRLKKDKISIYGRIIAVADVYDALVSQRSFRPAMYPVEAMEVIRGSAGTMFDPDIVKELEQVTSHYPTGVLVELSTGDKCLVAENFPNSPERPKLKMYGETEFIDLMNDPDYASVRIVRILEE